MVLVLGTGLNGKTTILEAISNAFGPYSKTADPNSFMKGKVQNGANYDLYALKSARLVLMAELNPGQPLDTGLIKRFTGGEELSARRMRQDFETFRPKSLPIMVSNHAPLFDGSDFGAARRMIVVNFDRTISSDQVDIDLPRKLEAEGAGIMNRVLEGLRRFQTQGYTPSEAVKTATDTLIKDSNQVGTFLDEHCVLDSTKKIGARELHRCYTSWCYSSGLRPMSMPHFIVAMQRTTGCVKKRTSSGETWFGVGLKVQ